MDPTAPNSDKDQKQPTASSPPPIDQDPQVPTFPQNPQPTATDPQATNPIQPGQFVTAPPDDPVAQQLPASPDQMSNYGSGPLPQAPSSPITPIAQPTQPLAQENLNLPTTAPFDQPNPAPYTSDQQPQSPQGSSKIGKLRLIAIVAAVLVLLALVFALIWFFVLGKKPKENAKTSAQTTPVEEPSPVPASPKSGFADLSQATAEATPQAAPSPPVE